MNLLKISQMKNYNSISRINKLKYPFFLITMILIALLVIEYHHPYFFLEDDNMGYYLPYFIHNYESFLNGEIALYNFHQFLGTPALAVGHSAVLYPLSYISVFLSKLIFGHYFATVDIEVILHLIIGAVGFYHFIRFFDVGPQVSCFGGLTWALSSFNVYSSTSWIVISAAVAYFPWMLLYSFRVYKSPSLKTTIYCVIIRLLLFYVGHVQYFIYSVIFEFITITIYVIFDSMPGERRIKIIDFLKNYILSYFYLFVLSLPLLLPMWYQTTISATRNSALVFEEFASRIFPIDQLLIGLFLPFPTLGDYVPLTYVGALSVYFLIIGIIIISFRKSKKLQYNLRLYVFLIPTLLALLWSTNWVFNLFIYIIPILNRFRWPFKLAFYFDFYLIVITTLFLSFLITQVSWKKTGKRILLYLIIGVQTLNFMVLYIQIPFNFGTHNDILPLEEKLKHNLVGGRIISAGFDIWSPSLGNPPSNFLTAPTLGFNYATLWELNNFAGYEPLISISNSEACLGLNFKAILDSNHSIPVEYLRKAGVKWYVVPASKANKYTKDLKDYAIQKKYEDKNRVILYDAQAYPMVFNSSGEEINSKFYQFNTNSIELNVHCHQSDIIIFNILYNPFFKGFIDGVKTELTPINDIHFYIAVPEGSHHIIVKYKNPYLLAGTYIAIIFLVLLVFIWMVRGFSKYLKYEDNVSGEISSWEFKT